MSETRFYTPQEAEAAFYAAFIKRDINAMMAVWAEDDNVACIHPLGQIITGHQAFFTHEALTNIAETTMGNVSDFEAGRPCRNEVTPDLIRPPVSALEDTKRLDSGFHRNDGKQNVP